MRALLGLLLLFTACGPGPVGPAGPQGPAGERGPKGDTGDVIDEVQVIRLCPGTPSYPSVFIEVAFCIDGKLYATYSANGGFSTELTPGAYHSNAIGSSCNFTVEPGCVIR